MRVNPNSTADLLNALATTQRVQDKALQELSSGKRITRPSDDSAGMAALVLNHSSLDENDQFSQSVSALKSMLQMSDSTLGSITTSIQRAISLGVEGATGTQSQANRDAIASELDGIRDNIISLANVSLNGTYLFSGTRTQTKPFTLDSSSAAGVAYNGNSATHSASVDENRALQMNVPGDTLFLSGDGNVFRSLNDLISGLRNGDGAAISSANSELKAAFDHFSSQRVVLGSSLSEADNAETLLKNEKLALEEEQNRIGGAEIEQSVSNLLNAQTARNATLGAAGQVSRLSLLDYIK